MQGLVVGLVELHGLTFKCAQDPLDAIPTLQHVSCSTQLVAVGKVAEGALNPTVCVSDSNVKMAPVSILTPEDITSHWSLLGH